MAKPYWKTMETPRRRSIRRRGSRVTSQVEAFIHDDEILGSVRAYDDDSARGEYRDDDVGEFLSVAAAKRAVEDVHSGKRMIRRFDAFGLMVERLPMMLHLASEFLDARSQKEHALMVERMKDYKSPFPIPIPMGNPNPTTPTKRRKAAR